MSRAVLLGSYALALGASCSFDASTRWQAPEPKPPPPPVCKLGDKRCNTAKGGDVIEQCAAGPDGAVAWTVATACGSEQICAANLVACVACQPGATYCKGQEVHRCIIHYFTIGVLFVVFWQILDHAAYGRGMSDIWPMPAILPVLAIVFASLALAQTPRTKTQPSPEGVLIAEEQHRAPMQLFFILPGVAVGLWLAIKLPGPARLLGVLLIAVMAWVAVAVLEGFKYVVRSDGVQVKGFLLPLRFIPRSSIHSYRTEPWNGLGYGIRLTSTGTAYIWGGKNVVNIATDHGNVMLGHYAPERLISDLDRMMQATS